LCLTPSVCSPPSAAAFGSWGVNYPETLHGVEGSCVLIPCTFSYPSTVTPANGIVAIWYKGYEEQRIVIYHSATPSEVDGQFQGRTELLSSPATQNCTLLLRGLRPEDSGKYNFRFEINEGDRWSDLRGVTLTVTGAPSSPTIAAPDDIREGTRVNFTCSSPYACPYDSITLQWRGYNAPGATVVGTVQLDTAGALHQETLVTSLSWQDHSKKLSCQVSVGAKQAVGEIALQVKYAPKGTKASLSPSAKNIRVGDSVTLSCSVNSKPSLPPHLLLHPREDGAQLGVSHVPRSLTQQGSGALGHLALFSARGAKQSSAPKAVTLWAAVLSVTPSAETQEGQRVTLSCDVPGDDSQDLTYSWYKNNVWLKAGTARALVFHQVAASDTGYYACKAHNDKGSEMSQVVGLSVFWPPLLTEITLLIQLDTQRGKNSFLFSCLWKEPITLIGKARGLPCRTSQKTFGGFLPVGNFEFLPNFFDFLAKKLKKSLHQSVSALAINFSGFGSDSSASLPLPAARVLISPSPEVREGDGVTLRCVATRSAEEGTSYIWYKNARWLKESSENALLLPAAGSKDAGAFQCTARNSRGSSTSPAVPLRVLFPPRRPLMSSLLETPDRHVGVILCTADSDPPAELALSRGDDLVASTSGSRALPGQRVSATASHNSLRVEIHEVALEDEGTYVCSARNALGNASASMVFSAETARIVATPASEVQEGRGVNLTCQVSSNSSATTSYRWNRNGQWLAEGLAGSLVFRQVASTDAGVYYCQATNNGTRRSSALLSLNVLYAPRNPRMTSFLEAELGSLAIIRCAVDSNPPALLSLYKGDELVASSGPGTAAAQRVSVTASQNSLRVELRDMTLEDEGSYRFTATNPYGTSSGQLYFRVQTARVLISPSPEVQEGDRVSLTCDVTGDAPEDATYTWYKNSRRVPEGSERSLAFPHVTSGDKKCRFTGSKACCSNAPSAVRIHSAKKCRFTGSKACCSNAPSAIGYIACFVEERPAGCTLFFYKNVVLSVCLSFQDSPETTGKRSSLLFFPFPSRMNFVTCTNVQVTCDTERTCDAENSVIGSVGGAATFFPPAARVWISPSPDVREGEAVNLTCAVDSDAPAMPHYTWYKNSIWFREGPARSLVFPKVAAADAGSYHCTATTQDRVRSSSPGALNVLYPPRNLWVKSFLEIPGGKLAIIACAVDSNPLSELALRRGAELVASDSSRGAGAAGGRLHVSASPNALKLEIRGVSVEDAGTYECLATNQVGKASASVRVSVETARVVIQPGPDVREGDPVTLTCEDTGARPSTVYTWHKNAKWLREGPAKAFTIRGAAAPDAGSYSCTAHDDGGRRTSLPTALQVLYAPKKPSLSSFLNAQDGRRAIIQCTVDSHPPSDLALYRGDKVTLVAATQGSPGLPSQRLSIQVSPNSLTVEMKDIVLEDAGQYVCSANNTYGIATASVRFGVETPSAVRVRIEPSQEIQEGAAVNVTCVVASWLGGETNYTWYKNSKWLQDGPASSLHLDRVTSTDTGSYHCRAEGRTGRATSALLSLDVLYAPRNPLLQAFLENRNARVGLLHCTADGNPQAELALYREDKLVASSHGPRSAANHRLSVFPSFNALRVEIRDVTSADSAEYTCLARNRLGNVTVTAYFRAQTLTELRTYKILAGLFITALLAGALAI
uniref:Sialic acid binding Ig like lectin 1 n=1 Tax=Pelodiscus sinensis TaxID=13735 RepID=K7FS18_PELSI